MLFFKSALKSDTLLFISISTMNREAMIPNTSGSPHTHERGERSCKTIWHRFSHRSQTMAINSRFIPDNPLNFHPKWFNLSASRLIHIPVTRGPHPGEGEGFGGTPEIRRWFPATCSDSALGDPQAALELPHDGDVHVAALEVPVAHDGRMQLLPVMHEAERHVLQVCAHDSKRSRDFA